MLLAAGGGLLLPALVSPSQPPLAAFGGLATWVDNWDWRHWPRSGTRAVAARVAEEMRTRGVDVLFIATSHHSQDEDIVRRRSVGLLLEEARARGMSVVAWYQPSFADVDRDHRRAVAATRMRSPRGERFDAFALDVESREVTPVSERNRRVAALARRIRRSVGRHYPLGAITPSPERLRRNPRSWPQFPYRELARHFDLFLPMAYWYYEAVDNRAAAFRYTRDSVNGIRHHTGRADLPVHVIGGPARHVTAAEIRGFVDAARHTGALGFGLYDHLTTTEAGWRELDAAEHGGPRP